MAFRGSGPPTDAIAEYAAQFPREESPINTGFFVSKSERRGYFDGTEDALS
jgi:hypothetical protein